MQNTSLFLIIATIAFSIGCTSPAEVLTVDISELAFSETENVQNFAQYKDAPFSGKAVSFHKDGKKFIEETYLAGKKEGPWRIWHPSGKLLKEGILIDGQNEGVYKEYYPSGVVKYEYHYDKGKRNGIWKSWYENEQQWTERHFENDILHGKVLVWDTDGTLTKEYTYTKGVMTAKQNHFEEVKKSVDP